MSNPLTDFLSQAQTGPGLSLETLFPATIIFPGQGNEGGYSGAASGIKEEKGFDTTRNVMTTQRLKSFRIVRALLTNDSVTYKAEVTHVVEGGLEYRVKVVGDRAADPCINLDCEQL